MGSNSNLDQQHQALLESLAPVGGQGNKKLSNLLQQSNDSPDVSAAKSYLQTTSERSGLNLYDHLSNIISKLLETRPSNAVDFIEQLSADLKKTNFQSDATDSATQFKRAKFFSNTLNKAKSNIRLLQSIVREDPVEAVQRAENGEAAYGGELPDMMELANIWEWAGVSLGKEDTFTLFLSLRKLAEQKALKSLRFWGKINGIQNNYYIAEGELSEGAADEDYTAGEALGSIEQQEALEDNLNAGNGKPNQVSEGAEAASQDAAKGAEESSEGTAQEQVKFAEGENSEQAKESNNNDVLSADFFGNDQDSAKSKFQKTPALSKEERTGVNRYVYYVCTQIGSNWIRLPDVSPEQLQASRNVRKYFRGQLNKRVQSYPPFNGTEAALLRCQIARISAATVISPAGYYAFDREEDEMNEEEDFEQNTAVIINPEYKGAANVALLDLNNWVHHVPYILPQGRTSWENPWARKQDGEGDENQQNEAEDEENENESNEGENGSETVQKEDGPALLSTVASDDLHDGQAAWSARVGSKLSPLKYSPVYLRSNRWPGAYAVAYGDKFCNVYIGDGLKDLGANQDYGNSAFHYPPALPPVQVEYEEAVIEEDDPTVEQEKAYEDDLRAQREQEEEQNEEEEEGEEEEN